MKIATRIALAAACAAGLSGAGATTASAGSHERILTKGGVVWFDHTGDYIAALDRRKDGLGVQGYLWWNDHKHHKIRFEEITDTRGYTPGPPSPRRAVYRSLKWIPEGTEVTMMLCYVDKSGDAERCSGEQTAEA
jgi:hypothetical protein